MDDGLNLLDGLDVEIPDFEAGIVTEEILSSAQFFGPYQLIQEVGQGGVAMVYRARHIHPRYAETSFALKVLHDDLSRDPNVVSLFRREAFVLSLLKHPNVVRTFEAGVQDDKLFITMEYIDGRDMDNMLIRAQKARIPTPIPVALFVLGEVLRGLAYAHELRDADSRPLSLVHRDVNPANVFLSYDGRVKLGDFGVASIAAGAVEKKRETAGKIGYFAPEQIEGSDVDQRADVFAVGVMMFEILCGSRLFEASTADKIMRLNRRAKIPRPSKLNPKIVPELEKVMLTSLERRPEDRFQSSREMLSAMQPFLPDTLGMPLAVAALMRIVFLKEHIEELQLQEGLTGSSPARGSGQLVAVCSTDARAQAAFRELLLSRSYRCKIYASVADLGRDTTSGAAPQAVLMDVAMPEFIPEHLLAAVGKASQPIPVIAVSGGLEPQWIHLASAIGAVDLLFRPFNIERVLTSVRAAITGAVKVTNPGRAPELGSDSGVRPKLLMVSQDPALIARLSTGLEERGFQVQVSPTTEEGLERSDHTSYHLAIYDAHPAAPHDRSFAGHLRARPGMGLVPILFLAAKDSHQLFDGVDADRSAILERNESCATVADLLFQLRADLRLGRTFIRYSGSLPVELRYGGRVFSGTAIDISRGGVMLQCDQIPPVGLEVGVALRLPTASAPIQVRGRVVRVDLAGDRDGKSGEYAYIGVEFDRFAGRSESEYIRFIAAIDPKRTPPRTVILGAPPAATS